MGAAEAVSTKAILSVQNLVKSYRGRKVVDGVSFHVGRGEVVGLLGPNGAGKTTSFRMSVGMIRPDGGSITLKGCEVNRMPMYRRARLGMGYLAQEPSVFRRLTVEDNITAILELQKLDRTQREKRLEHLLDDFGLTALRGNRAETLSGGERRRLEIARALVTDPAILLLDEPFSGIDPIAVSDIQETVKNLRDLGMGILLTDHNVRETLAVTDRSYIIHNGKIVRDGLPDDLVNDKLVRRIYLGEKFQM
jgi:lipopolysaccharide export system ATP-binding protein